MALSVWPPKQQKTMSLKKANSWSITYCGGRCRLLLPRHGGPEDGPGSSGGAGEGQGSCSGTAHGPVSRHLDPGGVTLVYLPLHWHPPNRGEQMLCFDKERHKWGMSVAAEMCHAATISGVFCRQTVLRVWDCLFYEGSKVLFRVALTLIMHHQPEILRARSLPDVCQCFKQITCGTFTLDCHTFMQVRQVPVVAKHWNYKLREVTSCVDFFFEKL